MPTAVEIQVDIPLLWKSSTKAPAATDSVLLLRVLALIEAAPPHFDEDESVESLRWQALEARIDLCVQMLGQLLARNEPEPPHCTAYLSGEHCRWHQAGAVTVGEQGYLGLRLSTQIPQLLWLPAVVAACQADGDAWQVEVRFQIHDAELQDWLDKTIFRHHRREISERKRHSLDEDDAT